MKPAIFDFNTLEQACLAEWGAQEWKLGLFTPETVFIRTHELFSTQQSQDAEFNLENGLGYVNPAFPFNTQFQIGATLVELYARIQREPSSKCAEIIDELVHPLSCRSVAEFTAQARRQNNSFLMYSYLSRHPPPRSSRFGSVVV